MDQQTWQLHPQLKADTHYLGRMPSAHLLLHRDAAIHWLILVPETDAVDLLDLPGSTRDALLKDAAIIAAKLKAVLNYPRVNVGALGLVVPQLHLHVVGRRPDDPCWPTPVWGNLNSAADYSQEEVSRLTGVLLDQR